MPHKTSKKEVCMHKQILPENRRRILKNLLQSTDRPIRLMEAHNGISSHIVEAANFQGKKFDGIWVSGLTETASKAIPDIELEGLLPRIEKVQEMAKVTNLPIVFDGDTGGTVEQFQYTVSMLESIGVSAVIIEDQAFPKKNSYLDCKEQALENSDVFANKIKAGCQARSSDDFLIFARTESLVVGLGVEEALKRAKKYVEAGAHAFLIQSKSPTGEEVFQFASQYKKLGLNAPLICIPTTYNHVLESELHGHGFQVIIHANQLLRAAHKAMSEAAVAILRESRSKEAEQMCTPLAELLNIIAKI